MTTAALILLTAQQSLFIAAATPAVRCLPAQDGFLSMRLRGGIDADVAWREPELQCTGMPRPDGLGLRLRFAGALPQGGELAVVFAAPNLAMGASGRAVPVNVTLIDGGGERIYGTQGDDRCVFDQVEQQRIDDAALPVQSYRVSASGFCVAPARAIDADGSVLVTRFDFAGHVTSSDRSSEPAPTLPPYLARLPEGRVSLVTTSGTHVFQVWIAADDASRERGLMHVTELAHDRGMLFLFDRPQPAAFWMKDTPLSLDIVFIGPDRTVLNVAERTEPMSRRPIESEGPVVAVLELAAGTASRIGIARGDAIDLPTLRTTSRDPEPQPRRRPAL